MKKQFAKLALTATLGLAITLTFNACEEKEANTFTDPRDKKTYKTVKIGEQVWMAENLNYAAEGSKCGGTELQEFEEGDGVFKYYTLEDKNTVNCDKYGRLYEWKIAKTACPSGWHLPTNEEWAVLMVAVGGEKTAGKYLKANSGWNDYEGKSGNGEDKFGFSALSGGGGDAGDRFDANGVGNDGHWWTASEKDSSVYGTAYGIIMRNEIENVISSSYLKSYAWSIRCIKD